MKVGLPMMLIIFPAMLFSLYMVLRPKLNHRAESKQKPLLPLGTVIVFDHVVFAITALAWIFGKSVRANSFGITQPDTSIQILAACMVVILGIATWKDCRQYGLGVLMLFGGGLTLVPF